MGIEDMRGKCTGFLREQFTLLVGIGVSLSANELKALGLIGCYFCIKHGLLQYLMIEL